MRFQVVCLSPPSVPTLCLKDSQMGDDIVYPELLTVGGGVRWNKLPGCWQLKYKKNSPLTINNYLLKHKWCHNNYIQYMYRERNYRFCCVWEADNWSILTGAFFFFFFVLFNFFESETFAEETLVLSRDFFSYSLVFGMNIRSFLSSNRKNIYLYREFPMGTNKPDWLTNHRSFCILLLPFNWSTNHTLIYVCGKSIPSTYQILVGHSIKPQYKGLVN